MVVDDLRGGILGSSLFAGCNNDDPVTPDAQPEIVFAKESLDVPAEGGPFQIEYTIENPVANATLSAKCNDSWITDIDTKTAGVISFNVTKNETAEKREAIIEVSYADIQPAPSFTAKQAARPEEAFTITISDITTKTFRTTVRPGDQEMYYLLNIIPSRAAADFKTDDELYQYDIDFYTDMDATGSGWQSWAQEYLEQGTIADRLIENMEPNTEYLVYAYGVDPITIERLTPISKKTLNPGTPNNRHKIRHTDRFDRRSQHRRSCQSERLRRPFCRKDLRQRRCGRYGCDRFGENIGKLDRQRTDLRMDGLHGRNDPEPIYLSTIQRNPGNARTELQILHLCLCRR